ncbi:unknown [Firmicutes bacterium CAG:95]|nr:unknown [Firmicutes bacterium CAG:95]
MIECMGDIGHNEASRSENVQKQATAEEIQEAIMRKMDIRKKKAGNISKIKGNQETRDRVYGR